ncbi:MAG: hypothetical protein KGI66_01350 [Patescibacteria group bacterium]|nr:hypothetical protein [Patescibacteria group bacterium]
MSTKEVKCFFCHKPVRADSSAKAILCGDCVSRLSDPPELPKALQPKPVDENGNPIIKKRGRPRKTDSAQPDAKPVKKERRSAAKTVSSGKGRGWHLKKVFEHEGQFYSFGKPITADEAKELSK